MKRTLSYRPVMPVRLGNWPGVLVHFDAAVPFASAPCDKERARRALDALRVKDDLWSDMPHTCGHDLPRYWPSALSIAAQRDDGSRFSVRRPLSFTLWILASWLRKR